MVNILGKSRDFKDAWILVLDRIGDGKEGSILVSVNTFVILIRPCARAGMTQPAIRTFEFSSSLDQICNFGEKTSLFEIMLDSLCKERHVRVASQYFTRKRETYLGWVPSFKVYNILLNGWFRSGHTPFRLTYHLLLKMPCEEETLDLAVQVSKEMRARECDSDLSASTMLIHLLCKKHRFGDTFGEFEDMIQRGTAPQYLTFQRMNDELKKRGMTEMASNYVI